MRNQPERTSARKPLAPIVAGAPADALKRQPIPATATWATYRFDS
jgi:hypothetical protein